MAIDNFEVQPYPLWAVLVSGDYKPIPARVIGWQSDGRTIRPVLGWGARSIPVGADEHVEFYESLNEARLNGPGFAERARRRDAEEAAKERG